MAAKKTAGKGVPALPEIKTSTVDVVLLGTSPLILHRLSEEAKHELLYPKGKKTEGGKATGKLKHNPLEEYMDSAYLIGNDKADTYLGIPSSSPKRAMSSAALDIEGVKKTQIGRLAWITASGSSHPEGMSELLGVYGMPQMVIKVVKSADMKKTPDIRTRCILPKWAVKMKVSYVAENIEKATVLRLLCAAGITVGVGDFRPEKGAGNYGQFTAMLIEDATEKVKALLEPCREQQKAAMANPTYYDDETKGLYLWWCGEYARRKGEKEEKEEEEEEEKEDAASA